MLIDPTPRASVPASPQGEPDPQAEDPIVQEKRSSIQKLKEQRNRALQAVDLVLDRQNAQDQIMSQILQELQELKGQKRSNRLEDKPLEELETMALNRELYDENPQNNLLAMQAYMKKSLASERERIRKEILEEVGQRGARQTEQSRVLTGLQVEFGADASNPQSELFQMANEKYIALQRRYGAEKVNAIPDLMFNCFYQAAKELGVSQHGAAGAAPRPAAAQPKPQGPPAEERIEGTGEGIADALARRKEHLKNGDWRASIQDRVKAMYPQE